MRHKGKCRKERWQEGKEDVISSEKNITKFWIFLNKKVCIMLLKYIYTAFRLVYAFFASGLFSFTADRAVFSHRPGYYIHSPINVLWRKNSAHFIVWFGYYWYYYVQSGMQNQNGGFSGGAECKFFIFLNFKYL